jgi:hypothetical protein
VEHAAIFQVRHPRQTDTRSPAVVSTRGSTIYAQDGDRELGPGVRLQDLGQQGIRWREIASSDKPWDPVPCGVSSTRLSDLLQGSGSDERQARSAHQRTRSVAPRASRRWIAPLRGATPNVRNDHVRRDPRASRRVVMRCPLTNLVDHTEPSSYFTSEWAAVGSHVIEPTGPMKGPNAVADVMPLGGRQMSW